MCHQKMQFTTTVRYNCTPSRMAIRNGKVTSVRGDMEKLESSHADGLVAVSQKVKPRVII